MSKITLVEIKEMEIGNEFPMYRQGKQGFNEWFKVINEKHAVRVKLAGEFTCIDITDTCKCFTGDYYMPSNVHEYEASFQVASDFLKNFTRP